MVSAHDLPQLYPLTGDPAVLTSYGDRYQGVAEAITAVARQLDLLANDEITVGESVDAMRKRTTEAAGGIRVVLPRYEESAGAIRDYAVALRDAQRRAGNAVTEADNLRAELFELYNRRHRFQNELESARYADGLVDVDDLIRSMNRVQVQIEDRESRLHAVWMDYGAAEGDKDAAALAAIQRIVPAAAATNDTLLEHIGEAWGNSIELMQAVADWVGDILYNTLFTLMVLQLVLTAVVVGLLAALLIAAVLLSAPGMIAIGSGLFDGLTWDSSLDAIIGAALVIIPPLTALLVAVLAVEALSPTPKVRREEPYWGQIVDKSDPRSRSGERFGDYEYLFHSGDLLDRRGGVESTYIDVVQVFDAQGNPAGWRVTLPSTTNWQVGFDWWEQGAANDLGSNLALMLTPDQKAGYERMVLQAMSQAGIGPNDPVMLVGFSQGGILAGKLAADTTLPYNVQALVVAGSPIDHLSIPSNVSVISLQHTGDVVHRLDGAPAVQTGTWRTIETEPSGEVHGATSYADTVATAFASTDAGLDLILKDQAMFFSDDEKRYVFSGREGQ